MRKKRYTARFNFEDGAWLVEIEEIPQVHTFGRTLAKARANVRDALGLWLQAEHPATLDIRDQFVDFSDELTAVVAEANAIRVLLTETSDRAQGLTARASQMLVGEMGLSVRDAAELLHISHQRVHQLVQDQQQARPA